MVFNRSGNKHGSSKSSNTNFRSHFSCKGIRMLTKINSEEDSLQSFGIILCIVIFLSHLNHYKGNKDCMNVI